MTLKINEDLKREIKMRNPLRDVMRDYGFHADGEKVECPFHRGDNDPSFHIYEPKDDHSEDNYHCYGCHAGHKGSPLKIRRGSETFEVIDAGSDVIAFVANMEMVPFPEACKILMRKCGMPVPSENPELDRAKQVVTDTNRSYWTELQGKPDVKQYLYDRGLDDADIDKWRLGWVPFTHPQINLRGRLAIGLMEAYTDPKHAQSIAMAYRALDNSKPKYLNDPSSPIYIKSKFLYGLTYALNNIRKRGYAVIMEGYFDVIKAHKHGLNNSVATCGTAFTEEQMDELRKYTDKIIFWYDGDGPGQEAMLRALPSLLKRGFNVQFVDSSPLDPDEMLTQYPDGKILAWIQKNARPALQVIIDRAADEFDTIVNKARVEAMEKLLPILDVTTRASDKTVYAAYMQKRFQL